LVIVMVSLFVAFVATLPNRMDVFEGVTIGNGLDPVVTIFVDPPSEVTVIVSITVPKTIGLNFAVSNVLSAPPTVDDAVVAAKTEVLVVTPVIVLALIEVFFKYAVSIEESFTALFENDSADTVAERTGDGVDPLSGILTNDDNELL
jgi:hypothetical protein